MSLRHGSLFSGYGGIDLALTDVFDAQTAWVADIDKGACKVLAHRFGDVPNLGDVTSIDWDDVAPIDVLSGGTPCQDLSHAGKRAGMTEGTRSNLWIAMREAIAALQPSIVVWENVRGAYSAPATSDVEREPGLLGSAADGSHLRAIGRVLGDLATLGYDAIWHGLRATDVGAPHLRFRVFVLAWRADSIGVLLNAGHDARRAERTEQRQARPRTTDGSGQPGARTERREAEQQDDDVDESADALLPTPAVNDMGDGKSLDWWDEWAPRQKASDGTAAPHGRSLAIEAQRLMPTPTSRDDTQVNDAPARTGGSSLTHATARMLPTPVGTDAIGARNKTANRSPDARPAASGTTLSDVSHEQTWGTYARAIERWEALTRDAPPPTEPDKKGRPRLSPWFTEWLMGLPAGWVNEVPDMTRAQALSLCGNGVLPQQCAAGVQAMHEFIRRENE